MPSSSGSLAADLRVRLLWLTLFRTVATTLVLGGLAVRFASRGWPELSGGDFASFGIIGTVYVLTLTTALLLRAGRRLQPAAWVQTIFDVALAWAVVFLTGGYESPFTFLFLLSVVGAALLLGQRGAWVAVIAVVATYAGFIFLALRGPMSRELMSRVLIDASLQLLAQMLIGVLAGYLGEQLVRAGGRLDASEQDLRQLTALQNEIVRAMPSGLVTCDEQGLVTFVNPAASAILGLTGQRVSDVTLDELLPGLTPFVGHVRLERRVATARGPRVLGLSVTRLGEGGGLLVVFQDLTELRRVERELADIDHLAELGRMSAQLAHEVRNPLAAMRGSAQIMAADAAGTPVARLAELIVRESDRLAALVEGYLKLARPPPPQRFALRLDQLVRDTLELLRADPEFAGVTVEERLQPVEAEVDGGQVKQVVLNLLRNASKAVGGNGRIVVKVAAAPRPGAAVIEVWDSAGAISAADVPRLFEPFFSRSHGGSGLGLSAVHSIVQAHGGEVTVASDPTTGTTFSVTLPSPQVGAHGSAAHR